MKNLIFSIFALAAVVAPASATTVSTPKNNAEMTSPFSLVASTETCDGHPAVSMGYSIDHGKTTITKTSFSAMVVAGEGKHVLHVKCWGKHGAAGDTNLNITIEAPVAPPPPPPPGGGGGGTGVTVVSDVQSNTDWVWTHDPGTPGNASGTSSIQAAPSLSGNARQYSVDFSGAGGEIFHTKVGADTNATHFVYSASVWLDDPSSLANIEMDMNQVIANGDTVIFGFQCDGYSGTWDYTLNIGTRTKPHDTWKHSSAACPAPKTWAPQTWHTVQISYSRDTDGVVTYESVVLDGNQQDLVGATGSSAFSLHWGSTLITNFQLDGLGSSGQITAYLDKVSVSRW
jgi:hypothetical protein